MESLVHFVQAPVEVTNAAFAMAQKHFNETRESLQDFARAGDMDGGGRPVGRGDPPVQDKGDPSAPARTDPPLTRDEWLDRNVAALEKTWEENNAHKTMLQREHARNEIDVLTADALRVDQKDLMHVTGDGKVNFAGEEPLISGDFKIADFELPAGYVSYVQLLMAASVPMRCCDASTSERRRSRGGNSIPRKQREIFPAGVSTNAPLACANCFVAAS